MDDSTRHLSVDCPKFDNYSLPPPPTVKSRGFGTAFDNDTAIEITSNQTDVILRPPITRWNDPRLPDIWESEAEGCTSWRLQMPAAFGFLGGGLPPLESPADFQFELACASTDIKKHTYPMIGGSLNTTTEEPYLSRAQCRVHSMFWITLMGLIAAQALVPSLLPEGKTVDLSKVRKFQVVLFALLLSLHIRLCSGDLNTEDFLAARLAALVSRYDADSILSQTIRAAALTTLLPTLWQFVVALYRSTPSTGHCKLGCRFWSAVARFEDNLVAGPSSFLPITPAEIYVRKALYISMFPFLSVFLTWPVDELMLNGVWLPVPFTFLALFYNRDSREEINEWEYWQRWRESARKNRVVDPVEGRALGCERCDENRLVLAS